MSKSCVACGHSIDAAARLCPYCGADPATGEKVDTQAILREVFQLRELSTSETVMEFARHRQGIVIATGVAVVFLILAGLHQFVTLRNNSAVASGPAVPLTDITDVSAPADENKPLPMPALNFQYDGRPQTMRTFIVEQGAVAPPEVVAAQQAAAAAQQAQQPGARPAAGVVPPNQPRPAIVVPPQRAPGTPPQQPR